MPLRFYIDHDMDSAELDRREAYERMFRKAPACLLNIDAIDGVMQSRSFFCISNHVDATVEYAIDGSADDTAIYFQRDWTKVGFLYTPYRMCISEPGAGKFYYKVKTLGQLNRVLMRWAGRVMRQDQTD